MRWRTPIGGIAVILGLTAYTVAAATLADLIPEHVLAQILYFFIAGVAWIPPAVWIIGWAKRDDS